ncbi:hypothetical protein [Halosimplex amylolyticum]|uniref:hypothetical protein n=1 Tax=Halosimplex amylolyticum TaxID=3396616 RepID=UPI003F54E157
MEVQRRSVLRLGICLVGLGCAGCSNRDACNAEIACFSFDHDGYDDNPDILTIEHTGGDDLPASEVYITNVAVDYREDQIETVRWHEYDDGSDRDDGIAGKSVQVPIAFPDVVRVLWRHDDDEKVIGETRAFR